jgi:hypothetical protein
MKRWRLLAIGLPLVALSIVCILGLASTARPAIDFAFLKGRKAVTDETREGGWMMDGVVGCGHGHCADEGAPSWGRQQEYTYQTDYKDLCRRADAEVARMGGRETEGIGDHRWELPSNVSLYISPVRFNPVDHCDYDDPGWVRVTVCQGGEEGAYGRCVRWFRSLSR